MPWVLETKGAWATSRERANLQFPEVLRDQSRLFAFGRDAFRLAQAMALGGLSTAGSIEGASGRLSLNTDGRIARQLSCQIVRNGQAASAL